MRQPKSIALTSLLLGLVVLTVGFVPSFPGLPATQSAEPTPTSLPYTQPPFNTKIGLHTRLTDEPSRENIEREFRMLKEMGGSWATEFFPWAYIQPSDPNRYDWEHADLVVDAARANGIPLIARLDGVPTWARPADKTWRYLAPERYADFGNFVHAFVSRYKDRVRHYIIWNEPNLASEWGQRAPDPAGYLELLKVAYTRAKEADPRSIVLMAGLAPTMERSDIAMNDLDYLSALYDEGAAPYFDALAAHSYGIKSPASDPPDPRKVNFRRVEELRDIMVQHGDAAKEVYMTEGGWNDSARWSFAVRPSQRVQYTLEAYELAREWEWLRAMCLWASRYPRPAYTYFDNYTFLAPDFTPKAVYLEVKEYAFTYPLRLDPKPPEVETR
jgi:hypothetical protein